MWNFIFGLALKIINMYMKRQARNEAMTQSYFKFLEQVDKAGLANVANYMAAESALAQKQKEIAERIKKEGQIGK